MNSKNKIMLGLTSFIMLSLTILPNLQADVEQESIDSANTLAKSGIIVDNSSDPKKYNFWDGITRREMLKIMMNLSWAPIWETCEQKFSDLPVSDWGCKYAMKALELGFIAPNTTFRPNADVSKIEALKMILRAKNIEPNITSDWRVWYVEKASELWYISKFSDYNTQAKRSFVFQIGAKTISSSSIKEEMTSYEKPKLLIQFDAPMNQASVAKNISIYPQVQFTSHWTDDENLELIIDDLIAKETNFLVNVFDSALTSSGEKLEKPYSKTFKVDGEALIELVTPSGILTDTYQNITVRFSKPMVSFTNLDNQAKCPIEIIPNISGKCVWITTSTFQFRPEAWFPTGGKYEVKIPAWISTLSGDVTKNAKTFEIITPEFQLLSVNDTSVQDTLQKDMPLQFVFNDEVSLETFQKYFSLSNISNEKLQFSYYQAEDALEKSTNTITVFPKSWDWGYSKTYQYTLSKNLTSNRGNVGMKTDVKGSFTTSDFLLWYYPFVFVNQKAEEKFDHMNIRYSQNREIITKEKPSIIFYFDKEMALDKSLFSAGIPFELNYRSDHDNESATFQLDKKAIILTFLENISSEVKVKINISKFSSSKDTLLTFKTKANNSVVSYKQINYKKACLQTSSPILPNVGAHFSFDKYGKVDYLYDVNEWTKDPECSYEPGKNKYILNMRLNPNTSYKLTIQSTLPDQDNYPLEKDYSLAFVTPKAQNEDKQVSIIDGRNNILVPNDVFPLSVGIKTINLTQAQVKVCQGDLDILTENYIKNAECNTQVIQVNDLGMKPNMTVIDIAKILQKPLSKWYITLEVEKLKADKTEYEAKNEYYTSKASFIISHIAATIKSSKNNIVWLYNYSSGENITDEVEKIESYTIQYNYGVVGKRSQETILEKEIAFTPKKDGIYELKDSNFQMLLITMTNGEKVFLDNMYASYYQNEEIYNYIVTNKPIYKAWETVEVSWISRILEAKWYQINTKELSVSVHDARYKEIFKTTLKPNSLGAFSFKIPLSKEATLGNYSLSVGWSAISFAVEEYEKPDFEVKTKAQKDVYLVSETPKIDVEANYYIGLPVASGEGEYTLSSQDFYFDGWKIAWYIFWEERNIWWGYMRDYSTKWWYYDTSFQTEKSGKFILWSLGKTTLSLDLEKALKDKIYIVSTTITDPNTKKSIASNTSFTFIRNKIFAGLQFDKYYYAYKDRANISFVSVDVEGNKIANQKLNYAVYKVDYTYDENTFQYNSKDTLVSEKMLTTGANAEAKEVFEFTQYGEYRFEIKAWEYTTSKTIYVSWGDILRPADEQHTLKIVSDKDEYKVGETARFVIASPVIWVKALITLEKKDEILNYTVIDIENYSQEIELVMKKEFLPNFTLGVYLIQDVLANKESLEALRALRIEMFQIEQKLQKEENENYIPYRVYDLSILPGVKNEDFDTDLLSQLALLRVKERDLLNKVLPNYYIGNKDVSVNRESITLSSQVKLDKGSYLPWDKQKIELTLTDSAGNPISGETTLTIIDSSLLALKDNKIDIVDYFYSPSYNSVQTFGNLPNLIQRIEFQVNDEASVQEQDFARWSLQFSSKSTFWVAAPEMAMDSMLLWDVAVESSQWASSSSWWGQNVSNATRLRTEFKDIAFYKAKVKVENGKALLEVPKLPDNLTTWTISGYAYTADSKVANYTNNFIVQKDIALLPQIPRFFIDGDISQISALVVNNTKTPKEVEVQFSMNHVKMLWDTTKKVSLWANSSVLVSFDVEVTSGELDSLTSASISLLWVSGELQDSVKVSKPIYPSKTSEYVFTNGSTKDLSYEEKLDFSTVSKQWGYLEISLGATLLTNLTKNLEKVLYFPGEDLSSRLTFLENALALEKLYKKLSKTSEFEAFVIKDYSDVSYRVKDLMNIIQSDIKNYLQTDNGLSYFKDCDSWTWSEKCSDMSLTAKYLNLNISALWVNNVSVLEYYKKALLNKIEENKKYSITTTSIKDFLPIALYKDTSFINTYFKPSEKLSNLEKLEYLEIYHLLGNSWEKSSRYLQELKNTILVEARGSVLPSSSAFSSSDNSLSTAKMIQELIRQKDSEKLFTENLVRFLLSNRDEEGNYYSYHFSEIIKAMTAYVDFTGELDNISFEAKTYLNSKDIMSSSFTKDNLFDIEKKTFDFKDVLIAGENSLWFEKTGNGKLYYDVWVRYYIPASEMSPREEGITVNRNYYNYLEYNEAFQKDCINIWWWYDRGWYCMLKKVKNIDGVNFAKKWDYIVGEIEIVLDKERTNVVINDFIPAWAEILNTNFNTTSTEIKDISGQNNKWWQRGFDFVEQKDDRIYLYAQYLPAGSYKYTYVLKANHIGNYTLKPAVAELLEKPEIWGRSSGGTFEIK